MSCLLLDRDQTFVVHDYGSDGYIGTASVNLQHGLKPGGVISVVTKTSEYMEINIRDLEGELLLHVANRLAKNEFGLNNNLKGKWGKEERIQPMPVHKGVKTVTTLVYEAEGYRLFINGKEITFYKHGSKSEPHIVQLPHYCQIYKIIYLTTKIIVP